MQLDAKHHAQRRRVKLLRVLVSNAHEKGFKFDERTSHEMLRCLSSMASYRLKLTISGKRAGCAGLICAETAN